MASDARATARRPESAHQPPADDETGGQRDANRDHRAFSYRPATSRQRLLLSAFPLLRALAEPARCAVGCMGNAVDGLVRNMSDTVDRRRSALAGARGSRIDCVVHLGPAFHVVARYVHVQPLSDRSRGSRRPSACCSQFEQAACHPPFAPETPKRPEIRKKTRAKTTGGNTKLRPRSRMLSGDVSREASAMCARRADWTDNSTLVALPTRWGPRGLAPPRYVSRRNRPRTSDTMNSTRKMKNNTFAISTAPAAIPPKPNNAAMSAITKNTTA